MQCSQCQQTFTCSAKQGSCWCFKLPNLLPAKNDSGCLCQHCLIEQLNRELDNLYASCSQKELLEKAAQYQNQMPVNGLDYYTNEQGFRVMTKWAHLKRGYCCGNGCLHCPY